MGPSQLMSADTPGLVYAKTYQEYQLTPCRTYLDLAYECVSFRGKLRDYYRHGTFRDCSCYYEEFYFCVKQKAYDGARAEEHFQERRKEKLQAYQTEQQSKDHLRLEAIWSVRSVPPPEFASSEQMAGEEPHL